MAKLTRPQSELLQDLAESDQGIDEGYKPAVKLVSLGFAEWKFTRNWQYLRITEAGRAALQSKGGKDG